MKWKQIRKLDTMEKDLNKLKYLSELPLMFKKALADFQAQPEGEKDTSVFKEPTQYYSDYSDILTDYKQTKFMISLYGEIKSYISRIKTHLNKQLEQLAAASPGTEQNGISKSQDQISAEAKMIVRYLLVFQDDKSHLKVQFLKVKNKQVQDNLASSSSKTTEAGYQQL